MLISPFNYVVCNVHFFVFLNGYTQGFLQVWRRNCPSPQPHHAWTLATMASTQRGSLQRALPETRWRTPGQGCRGGRGGRGVVRGWRPEVKNSTKHQTEKLVTLVILVIDWFLGYFIPKVWSMSKHKTLIFISTHFFWSLAAEKGFEKNCSTLRRKPVLEKWGNIIIHF